MSYCLSDTCLRGKLLGYFDFPLDANRVGTIPCSCCSICNNDDSDFLPYSATVRTARVVNNLAKIEIANEFDNLLADLDTSATSDICSLVDNMSTASVSEALQKVLINVETVKDETCLLHSFDIWDESISRKAYEIIERFSSLCN